MNTDLSPHCKKLIYELKNCRDQHTFAKFIGICNKIDSAVVNCLEQEHIARSAANRAKAAERQTELKRRMYQNQ